jgi:hypothetical protein
MYPDYQQALQDYNHAWFFFNNVSVNDGQYRMDSAIYNLVSAEKNLCAVINKYKTSN